jgi:hypothetical protein
MDFYRPVRCLSKLGDTMKDQILAPFGFRRLAPSPRAQAIAAGLVRTGRATNLRVTGNFVRADGLGATYWVRTDGTGVLRGHMIGGADELQTGFIEAMVRAGSEEDHSRRP